MAVQRNKATKTKKAAKKAVPAQPQVAEQWSIKHRPTTLDDFILSPENRALVEAIVTGKKRPKTLSITGSSGTGKTSISYLIAEALTGGSKVDFIEHDCTDKGTIDDIRALLREVGYLPAKKGAKRVILLDEAHSLSQKSASPLLKVLENPDPHTVWIICTDQAGKVLPTVRSRGMHIQLAAPSLEDAAAYLLRVIKTEKALPTGWSAKDVRQFVLVCAAASGGNLRTALQLCEAALVSIDSLGLKTWKEAAAADIIPAVSLRVPQTVQALFRAVNETLTTGKSQYSSLRTLQGMSGMEILDAIIDTSTAVLLGRAEPVARTVFYIEAMQLAFAARDAILTVPASSGHREATARAVAVAASLLRVAHKVTTEAIKGK